MYVFVYVRSCKHIYREIYIYIHKYIAGDANKIYICVYNEKCEDSISRMTAIKTRYGFVRCIDTCSFSRGPTPLCRHSFVSASYIFGAAFSSQRRPTRPPRVWGVRTPESTKRKGLLRLAATAAKATKKPIPLFGGVGDGR